MIFRYIFLTPSSSPLTTMLIDNYLDHENLEQESNRDGYGRGLVRAGEENEAVVALCADLTGSTRAKAFSEQFPERFIEVGVAEQNMMGIAAGLALSGKIPFHSSYAVFSPGRNWDQLRVSVCYSNANVKIVGAHAGLSVGPDGATHQALEDIAITRVLPNLTVIVPADGREAEKATLAAAAHQGPVYLRLSRANTPLFTAPDAPFEIGKAVVLREGTDLTLIACGPLLYEALRAADLVKDTLSVEVINCATVKPLDTDTIFASAQKTGRVVTVEEHQVAGGMGSAVAEALSDAHPTPVHRWGVTDRFGESGDPYELWQHFQLDAESLAKRLQELRTGS